MFSAVLQAGHGVDIQHRCKLCTAHTLSQQLSTVHLLGCRLYRTTILVPQFKPITMDRLSNIHLWASGKRSPAQYVPAIGAGFVIFVRGTLRVTEASLAGHGISKLRAEATACFTGPQAVPTYRIIKACQGVRVLSDSKLKVLLVGQTPYAAPSGWFLQPLVHRT